MAQRREFEALTDPHGTLFSLEILQRRPQAPHDRRASPLFRETLVCLKKLLPNRAKGLKPFAQIRYGVIDLVGELAPELVSEMTERGGSNELPVFIEHLTVPAHIMRKML